MKHRYTSLVALSVANFWCGFACIGQTSTSSSPIQVQASSIDQATLLSSTEGYVTAGNRIFYTATLGESWTDITPKEGKGSLIANEFSSPTEGTAYYTSAQEIGGPASIQVLQSTTRGSSWSALKSVSGGQALKDWGGLAKSASFDSQHMWLTVKQASSTAFSFSDLFSTIDGGKSWKILPSPPVFGQLRFISPTVGFLLGGFDDQELYRTSNGGQTWIRVQFEEEKELTREIEVSLSLPRFENRSNGSVIVSVVKGATTTTTAYGTTDGGANWFKTTSRSLAATHVSRLGTDSTDPVVVPIQAGSNIYTSHVSGTAKLFALPKSSNEAFVSHASFSGDRVGWIVVHSGDSDTLMLTKDGGANYEDVTPGADVEADLKLGSMVGVEGTPTVFIDGVKQPPFRSPEPRIGALSNACVQASK